MIIFTKYSNERDPHFCVQTEIHMDETGRKCVYKKPSFPEAVGHVNSIFQKYQWLSEDLQKTGLAVNVCEQMRDDTVCFPYVEGRTLEEELDELLEKGKTDELVSKIRDYFSCFSETETDFEETEAFVQIFGQTSFSKKQRCRRVSDIDMIFSNAVQTGHGYELIDYEWTFDFPVPVRFLQYRCLYYYVLGNAKRDALAHRRTWTGCKAEADIYALFDITEEECRQFAQMEQNFQRYMQGSYTPIWKLYDDISDGVLPVMPLVRKYADEQRAMRTVEVYFDDGRGYGIWNFRRYQAETEGVSRLRIELPEGTRAVRIDPCALKSVVRIGKLTQKDCNLEFSCNGERTPGGDVIFDTEDPQLWITSLPHGTAPIELEFLTEPMNGLAREVILNQNGRLRWMEQTKVWRAYRKLKKGQ